MTSHHLYIFLDSTHFAIILVFKRIPFHSDQGSECNLKLVLQKRRTVEKEVAVSSSLNFVPSCSFSVSPLQSEEGSSRTRDFLHLYFVSSNPFASSFFLYHYSKSSKLPSSCWLVDVHPSLLLLGHDLCDIFP